MAKNREPVKPVESESDSSEEEEDDASSEEIGQRDSDSEPEQMQVSKKPSSSTPAALKKIQPPSSSEEEESGSDSDSDLHPNIKPLASKPMVDPSVDGGRKSRSTPNVAEVASPAKSTSTKRPAEDIETDVKRSKKKPGVENSGNKSNDESKKVLFQRLWSEDDEIVILEGMIEYSNKYKSDPVADLNAFHDFIKKNLHVDVTRTQLQDKIRRLKKKYVNNKRKEKEGKDKTFSKPHEQKAYEISKKIWGNDSSKENGGEKVMGAPGANGSAVRKTPSKNTTLAVKEESSVKAIDVGSSGGKDLYPATRLHSLGPGVEERILGIGAQLFEAGKALEGEQDWKKLKIKEIEVYLMQLEVKRAQTKLVLDALKS